MAIIYVRKSGSDANSGLTIPLAKLTIAGANAIAVSGDTVNIGVGTFTETDQLCAVSNVTYQGAALSQTIVSGNIKYINGAHIGLVNDLKVSVTTMTGWGATGLFNGAGSYATFNRVWVDWSAIAVGTGPATAFAVTPTVSKYSNCIFSNYSCITANFFVAVIANSNLKLYNCIFFNNSNGITPGIIPTVYYDNGFVNTVTVKNCIFHTCAPQYGTGIYNPANLLSTHTNNCHYNISGTDPVPNFTPTEFVGNPLFIDPANGDFRLQATSPCIGKGTGTLP